MNTSELLEMAHSSHRLLSGAAPMTQTVVHEGSRPDTDANA